ncbi:hypothetical protein VTI74DRAFT_1292 [Chaetomium olivicolor]
MINTPRAWPIVSAIGPRPVSFGGVVLFDRRDPESVPDAVPDVTYLHPDRRNIIYRIYRLRDSQREELTQFLLSDTTPPQHCPLPILPSEANRQRVDTEQAIETTGIYRDPRERRVRPWHESDRRMRDVVDVFNYLSRQDYQAARRRAFDERREKQLRELEGRRREAA